MTDMHNTYHDGDRPDCRPVCPLCGAQMPPSDGNPQSATDIGLLDRTHSLLWRAAMGTLLGRAVHDIENWAACLSLAASRLGERPEDQRSAETIEASIRSLRGVTGATTGIRRLRRENLNTRPISLDAFHHLQLDMQESLQLHVSKEQANDSSTLLFDSGVATSCLLASGCCVADWVGSAPSSHIRSTTAAAGGALRVRYSARAASSVVRSELAFQRWIPWLCWLGGGSGGVELGDRGIEVAWWIPGREQDAYQGEDPQGLDH